MTALALLLADARLPAAGHTQSGGLEPGLADGLDPAELPAYCRTRLATVARTEAATAVVARHRAGIRAPLDPVEDAWAARTPSDAMRETSRHLGRGLLRLARRAWPQAAAHWPEGTPGGARPPRALVLGAVAAETGLPAVDLARVVGYDDVQTVLAAALKLLPLDPADATAWCVGLLTDIDRFAEELAGLSEPDEIPATGSPQIEGWAQAHARTTRRLFSA